MSTKQYFFKNPKTGDVYGYSSDEINKVPQLVNCLELISEGEMRKLTQGGGVSLNKEKLSDPNYCISDSDLLDGKYLLAQQGKKKYFLIIAK